MTWGRKMEPGDYLVLDDRTGFTIRASEAKKEWNGLRVHRDKWEPRHPQDFVRGRREDPSVKDGRPEPTYQFQGPLSTRIDSAASPGDQTITVESSVRMAGGDNLRIMLDGGDVFLGVIQSLPSSTSITLTEPLTGAASVDNWVVDISAVSEPDLG